MRTASKVTIAALALLALVATTEARAQTCTGNPCSVNNTASVTVATVMRLTLSSVATALTPPDEAAYDLGSQDDGGPTATVKANRPWTLNISSSTALWAGANGARVDKPASDLEWSPDGVAYAGLSTVPAAVTSGSGTSGAFQGMFYRTIWGYASDTPGDYSLVVVYTLTAP